MLACGFSLVLPYPHKSQSVRASGGSVSRTGKAES